MRLDQLVYSQGFGTRRHCAGLIAAGLVAVEGRACLDPAAEVDALPGVTAFSVEGRPWLFHDKAYLLLHKPAGYECSQRPGAWPGVHTLLPAPLRQRPGGGKSPGVQAVGRLDQDTTGLLLLSDDGQFIHRMSSPKKHLPKVYEVTAKHALDDKQVKRLLEGVVLDDDPKPVRAAACEIVDAPGEARHLRLTLTEGKYHQVKRMLAAVGNRVEGLHRSRVGGLDLRGLAPGEWCWLREADLQLLKPLQL